MVKYNVVTNETIRDFLTKLTYHVRDFQHPNENHWFVYVYDDNGSIVSGSEQKKQHKALQAALNHFLRKELGRKWQLTWESIEQVGRVFDGQEILAIETAIGFYEHLERQSSG